MSLTKEMLDSIDALLQEEGVSPFSMMSDVAPPWYGGAVFEEAPVELAALGVTGLAKVDRLRSRSKYESSRWVFVKDPEDPTKTRFVPELHLRCVLQFGPLAPSSMCAWTGGGDVKVFQRVGKKEVKLNAYGAPTGTAEYHKQWRAANPDKVKSNNKKHYEKVRTALDEQKERKRKEKQDGFSEQLEKIKNG